MRTYIQIAGLLWCLTFIGCYFASPFYGMEKRMGNGVRIDKRFALYECLDAETCAPNQTNIFLVINAKRGINYAVVIKGRYAHPQRKNRYVVQQYFLQCRRWSREKLYAKCFPYDGELESLLKDFDVVIDLSDLYEMNCNFSGAGIKTDDWGVNIVTRRYFGNKYVYPFWEIGTCSQSVSREFDNYSQVLEYMKRHAGG